MKIGDKTYNLNQLRDKMPKYDMFFPTKIEPGSHEHKVDQDPIGTTNPNLHLRFDSSKQIKRGKNEIADRQYTFLGLIGTKIYSFVEKFIHDENDTDESEIP